MTRPRRFIPMFFGLAIFLAVVMAPSLPDASDPAGRIVQLSHEGKAALGLFLLAGIWWVFEVIPVGVTGITVGVVQAFFLIREPRVALTDFMDPSVWFIFGSLTIGAAFAKTGLTRRLAFKMLTRIPEQTSAIYFGVFAITAMLTLVMAHTAVAAALFPLLLTIHHLYEPTGKRTRFGKGLFIGMAWTAGAGSIITLLGAARGAVALGFFRELTGRNITFAQLTYYMLPLGVVMVVLLWAYICFVFKPEKSHVPGLQKKAHSLYEGLGPLKPSEIATLGIVIMVIVILSLHSVLPVLASFHKSAVILGATLLFFVSGILDIKDLESIPWNIVLHFGGAMSLGFCLWQTGAAEWMAIGWLGSLETAPWIVFVMGIAFLVLIMTNFIMNVAAIAITMPVALVMAPYIGVSADVVMFASLAAAGMPFLLLVGAAPNAIAYESHQFTAKDFFVSGLAPSAGLLIIISIFVWKIWPWMGMSTVLPVTI